MQATPLLSVQSGSGPASGKRVLLAALLLVLLLHWAFLSGWLLGASGKPPPDAPPSRLIQFREVTLAAALPPALAQTATEVSPAIARATPPSPRPQRTQTPSPTLSAQTSDPAVVPPAPVPVPKQESEPVPIAQAASESDPMTPTEPPIQAASDPGSVQAWPGVDSDAPVYRVALPPSFKHSYSVKRGLLTGTGELSWTPAGGRYEVQLNAFFFGQQVLTQHSQGRFDVTGLEPERFTSKTSGRAALAANFQRQEGVISFSGPNRRYAWRLGAQDRVSIYVQLAAILAAESSRLAQGQRFGVPVVSERGDADIWTFRIVGWEVVETKSGEVRAVRLLREMRKPTDQAAEIWMDEKLHYVPVRIRLGNENDANRWELLRD
ncbi:MAG: DUF3108 domain-containing protein [Rhizobacter sp.]